MSDYQILSGLTAEYIEALKERFWSKADRSGGRDTCWEWQGAKNSKGYGAIGVMGKSQSAHRVAYELAHGPLGSLMACHACDNPSCVNPNHLFKGTSTDNVRDMVAKGRNNPYGSAALTKAEVRDIRQKYKTGLCSVGDLAIEYGVTQSTIGRILKGKTYARVHGPIVKRLSRSPIPMDTAKSVRTLYRQGKGNIITLAAEFGISKSSVHRIVTNQSHI